MITINGTEVEEIANKTHVIISKKEYFDLLVCKETLNRLESGGVHHWDWYSESLYPDGEKSICFFEKKLKKEIFG
jgi:hypothetical protein